MCYLHNKQPTTVVCGIQLSNLNTTHLSRNTCCVYRVYLMLHPHKDTYLQSVKISQDVGVTQGLHTFEGCLGQLGLLLCPLCNLVHKNRHRLSIGLRTQMGLKLVSQIPDIMSFINVLGPHLSV